jgi:hypothetical protein
MEHSSGRQRACEVNRYATVHERGGRVTAGSNYFGHNWSALRDCVNDLSWLKGASYLIIFDAAEQLLSPLESGSPEKHS